MQLYAGMDLHSRNTLVAVMDSGFRRVFQKRVANDLALLLATLEPFRDDLRGIAVESTYNWYWLVDGLMEAGYRVHLANPSGIKQYERLKLRKSFQSLLTVPGIGDIVALTIMLEVGDIARFAKVGNFASYARCVSSKRLSDGKKKGQGNRKNGNRYLAWAFVEASHYARRHNERLRKYYQRKLAETNEAVATKALCNKLSRACSYIRRDQVAFREEALFCS